MRKLLILFLALVLPISLSAQEGSLTEMVPRELALALLGGFRSPAEEAPEIRVGESPAGFPSAALPPRAKVLGSLIRRVNRPVGTGTASSVIVVVSPQEPDSALASLSQALLRSGWKEHSFDGPRGGFISREPQRPRTYCGPESFLSVWARPREQEGGSLLQISQQPEQPGPCDPRRPPPPPPPGAEMRPEPPIPPLRAPEGVVTQGGGITGRGLDHWESSTRLQTRRSARELVAHYSAQLGQSGWAPMSQASSTGFFTQTLRLQDSSGQSWQGVLLAVELPSTNQREVVFRAMRPSTRGEPRIR